MSVRSRKRQSLTRQVRRTYKQDDLARVLMMPARDFGDAFGMETVEVRREKSTATWQSARGGLQPADHYHFKDQDSRVLSVSHLDTVVSPDRRAPRFRNTQEGPMLVSGALDDRLGAYITLKMLPDLGIKCDQLLTVGEEDGQSTASFFDAPKDYDWVIEFDRGGTDVVMYQFEDDDSREKVEACGAQMGVGSFSDIAFMEHLGVKAFNWGAGYGGDYHSERGYAFLADTFGSVARYLRFHEQNAGQPMPHDRGDDPFGLYRSSDWDDEDSGKCWYCGELATVIDGYCSECDACQDCGDFEDACLCYKRREMSGRPVGVTVSADSELLAVTAGDDSEPGWLAQAVERAERASA